MRQAAFDGHRAAVADERLSCGQPILDDGKQIVRQVGDIGHGLMLDLAIPFFCQLQNDATDTPSHSQNSATVSPDSRRCRIRSAHSQCFP